jgi:hypothetical protein
MVGQEVSSGEIKRRLNDAERAEIDRHLSEGKGVALYGDERGSAALIVTYGSRDADLPNQYPPSHFGRGELQSYVPVPKRANPMKSPLMEYEQPRQIARPRVSPSFTEVPDVRITMREGNHPRAHSASLINPERLLPSSGREAEQVLPPPQEPLSEGARWWRDQLSGRS